MVDQASASSDLHIDLYLNKTEIFRDKILHLPLSDLEAFTDYSGPIASFDYSMEHIVKRFELIYSNVAGTELSVLYNSSLMYDVDNSNYFPPFFQTGILLVGHSSRSMVKIIKCKSG